MRPAGPGRMALTFPMNSSKRPSSARLLDLVAPVAPRGRGAAEHLADEVDALVEGEALEGVDAGAVEQAARHVQVLLVRVRVAPQRDALGARVHAVDPLVHGGDARADDDVAPALVVLLRLVGLDHPVGGLGVVARLAVHAGEGERAVADRDQAVLAAADQLRVLVVQREVRRRPRLAGDPADLHAAEDALVVAELLADDGGLGEDLGHARVELPARGAEQRRQAAAGGRVHLGERRPVGRREMRLRLRAQHRLTQVPGELLVGLHRVRVLAEDPDLLGAKTEVDGGRVDEDRAEAVPDDADDYVF